MLGAGDDRFQWDPGDGSDTVEGQGGSNALSFNGSNIAEHIDVSANGSRVRLTRNVAAITMDFDNIQRLDLRALGGSDAITVNDMTGTDLKSANVDLGAFDGTGDGAADTVTVNGTNRADRVHVTRSGSQVLTTRAGGADDDQTAARESTTRCGSTRSTAATRSRSIRTPSC